MVLIRAYEEIITVHEQETDLKINLDPQYITVVRKLNMRCIPLTF